MQNVEPSESVSDGDQEGTESTLKDRRLEDQAEKKRQKGATDSK